LQIRSLQAPNPADITVKRDGAVKGYVDEQFDMAKTNFDVAKSDKKDVESMIRAEYYASLAMLYLPEYPGAAELLSDARKVNKNAYSAYVSVLEGKPNPKVNKYDIMLAVNSDNGRNLEVRFFNNSYNPLRLKAEHFFLVDAQDQKVAALPASKLPEDYVDQSHEAKINLVFPAPAGTVKKLVYDTGEHYTEKVFF
jgi:hypothetical protein